MTNPTTITDAKGRKIDVTVLGPADMLQMLEAVGDASSNAGYVRYASVVYSVSAIDGVPMPRPTQKRHILDAAARLGNEGFAAVATHLFGDAEPADGGAAALKSEVDMAKNS